MRTGSVPNPATDCKQGAAEPAHLTLTKAIDNTGGGTAQATDWTLSATGPTTISGHTGDPAITAAAVGAGTYILAEAGPAGYSASAWGCTGGTLTGSSLVLAAGATASCSITNTFVPVPPEPAHLTLTKAIDNTGGGTAQATDWTLSATGPTTISGHTGDPAITAAAVGAGTYILAETGPAGYSASAWGCTGGTLTGSSLVLAAGATASCSITNTFVPVPPEPAHLTLTKAIDNTGGGTAQATDWTLSATGPTTISGHTGDPAITAAAVGAGTYILAETGPAGYSAERLGVHRRHAHRQQPRPRRRRRPPSCSITNTFVPVPPEPAHLTLTKAIDNTGGGTAQATDWTLSATGPTTISGHTGDPAITAAAVGAGTYILAETGPAGYSASAWGCTGGTLTGSSLVLAAGETASCSITNTFVPVPPEPAHLTLTKAIDNTGGGTAQATDWTLSATGPTTISGHTGDPAITAAAVGAGTYILAEAGPAGYSASAWGCTGGTLTGSSLVLAAGATASCSITNTFVPTRRHSGSSPRPRRLATYTSRDGPDPADHPLQRLRREDPPEHPPWRLLLLQHRDGERRRRRHDLPVHHELERRAVPAQPGPRVHLRRELQEDREHVSTDGGATGTFTFAAAGTYILHLQYQTKSIAGTEAPNPINPTYTFDTEINGVEVVPDTTSIDLTKF